MPGGQSGTQRGGDVLPWLKLWAEMSARVKDTGDVGIPDRLVRPFQSCVHRNFYNNRPMSIDQTKSAF